MVDGDVKVYIELIPTRESIEKSANNLVNEIKSKFNSFNLNDFSESESGVESKSSDSNNLLGTIASGVALGNFIWSGLSDLLTPILKIFKVILVLLFLPLINLLVPVLKQLSTWLTDPKVIGLVSDVSSKASGEQGLGYQVGTTGGALGGGIIGGIFGGTIGALAGAAIGAYFVNLVAEVVGVPLIRFGMFLGSLLNDYIIEPLISFGMNLGQEILNFVSTFIGLSQAFTANLSNWFDIIIKTFSELFDGGFWETVMSVVNYIGESVFGKDTWDKIKELIVNIATMLLNGFNSVIDVLNSIVGGFVGVYNGIQKLLSDVSGGMLGGDKMKAPVIEKINVEKTIDSLKNVFDVSSKKDKKPSVNINNYLKVEAGVNSELAKKYFKDFSRMQGREVRNKVSYSGG